VDYYLTTLKYVYLYRAANQEDEKLPLPISRNYAIALVILTLAIILVGTVFAPWYSIATNAALSLF
jgi:hypothetical protein